MKVHACKAETMFDIARTSFYFAISSTDSLQINAK